MRLLSRLRLNLLFLVVLQSGCIIQSKQVSGLLDLIQEPSLDLSDHSWTLKYANYETLVYAISTPKGTLFSNTMGDQVLFDGWVFRKVRGMGSRQLDIDIDQIDYSRYFRRGARVISRHYCDEWKAFENDMMVKFSQDCSYRESYKNSITVNETGDISLISQIVDETYTPLRLIKLN